MKKTINKVIGFILILTLSVTTSVFSVSAKFGEEIDIVKLERDGYFFNVYNINGKQISLYTSNRRDYRSAEEGAAYYIVDDEEKTATFYGGDGTQPNIVYSAIWETWGRQLNGITFNDNIEHIVFTDDYTINPKHFKYVDNLKDVILLNDAEITLLDSATFGGTDYIIYGTTQHHRDIAETLHRRFYDLNEAKLDAADNTSVNIDETNNVISGLTPKIGTDVLTESYLSPKACDAVIDSNTEYVGTGDKVNLVKWIDDSDAGSYDILLYGDVDGDGVYDARDAYYVNLMANGLLTEEQVGSLVWSAADCNHDGAVDENDAALLEQAGLLLANVDQSKSGDELQQDAAFSDYVELIDQNPPAEDPADEPVQPETPSFIQRLIEIIISVIAIIKSFIVK